MRDAFGKHLLKLAQQDERVIVIDGDLANSTKTNLIAEQLPTQFIQGGIAEQNMVTMAGGLATTGFQPWICTFTSFLTKRALDQIVVSVAQPKLNVKLIGAYSGILNGKVGKTHQGIEDIALMRTIPGMVILCPADGEELIQMMSWANSYDGPVYIRLTRESNAMFSPHYQWIPYKGEKISKGKDIAMISTGTHTYYAQMAFYELSKEKIYVNLIHIPMIKPIDKDIIIETAKNSKAIVTVEDHSIIGGLGSAVAEITSEFYPVIVKRIGIKDKNIEAGTNEELLDKYELSTDYIVKTIKNLLN